MCRGSPLLTMKDQYRYVMECCTQWHSKAVSYVSDHKREVRATRANRLRVFRGRTQEASRERIGSSSSSDSRENIKTFDRLNGLNFGRFARPPARFTSTEDTAMQTATLMFSFRPRRPQMIADVRHRVRSSIICVDWINVAQDRDRWVITWTR
jgi:hypothetical protein